MGLYRAAQAMMIFTMIGMLAACSKDTRRADIKACIADAQQRAEQFVIPPNASAEDKHDRIGAEVAACMEERGYRHDDGSMTDERCVDDVDYNPYCYAPNR